MQLKLSSAGNPDFDQFSPLSPDEITEVSSFEEASEVCRSYIEKYSLGGGNWTGGQIDTSHRVSFNGKVWELKNTGDWKDDPCVYNPQSL